MCVVLSSSVYSKYLPIIFTAQRFCCSNSLLELSVDNRGTYLLYTSSIQLTPFPTLLLTIPKGYYDFFLNLCWKHLNWTSIT